MDLSIIIASHNTKKLTLEAIDSIYAEGSNINFEVIVIDNGSSDGSAQALKEVRKKRVNFKLIKNPSNKGFSFANNQGIRVSKGKYIFLLNSDTVVKKGAFQKILDFAETKDDIGIVSPKLLNADGTIQPSCLRFPTLKNAILEYWFNQKGLFDKYSPKVDGPVKVDSVVGAAFLITPRALKKVGLFNEKYFFYFEDIDYCRRVKKAGLSVYYYPESEVIHYHGASGENVADPKDQWRRLVPSSIIYHGYIKHHLLFLVIWLGLKWQKVLKTKNG